MAKNSSNLILGGEFNGREKRLRLIVGLGNPGPDYRKTRHNIGFMVLDSLGNRFSIPIRQRKTDIVFGIGAIKERGVVLAKPKAFMNRSGPPTWCLTEYLGISADDLIVVHDDIDLAFGRLKIKTKGGDGGHKGLQSLMDAFERGDFTRLRIGIGRPEENGSVTDHVLGHFAPSENRMLGNIITRAQEAVIAIISKGALESMNRFNKK